MISSPRRGEDDPLRAAVIGVGPTLDPTQPLHRAKLAADIGSVAETAVDQAGLGAPLIRLMQTEQQIKLLRAHPQRPQHLGQVDAQQARRTRDPPSKRVVEGVGAGLVNGHAHFIACARIVVKPDRPSEGRSAGSAFAHPLRGALGRPPQPGLHHSRGCTGGGARGPTAPEQSCSMGRRVVRRAQPASRLQVTTASVNPTSAKGGNLDCCEPVDSR